LLKRPFHVKFTGQYFSGIILMLKLHSNSLVFRTLLFQKLSIYRHFQYEGLNEFHQIFTRVDYLLEWFAFYLV